MLFVTIIYVVVHSNLVYGFENGFGDSFSFLSLSLSLSLSALMMRPAKAYFGLCVYFQVFMK
jgi:hypothetical protein